jgi:phospholipase C
MTVAYPQTVRGALTEGRFLVFESNGNALALDARNEALSISPAVPSHDAPELRFILHATASPPATTFNLEFSGSRRFVCNTLRQASSTCEAAVFNITDLGNGQGYTVENISGKKFLSISGHPLRLVSGDEAGKFSVFSVTKSTDSGHGF